MLDLAGLRSRFGAAEIDALADWDGDGVADPEVVARIIADAEERVAAACTRYRLPFSPVPGLIAGLAADIAYYRLHRIAAPEEVRRRYQDALKALDDIAAGKLRLAVPLADGGAAEPAPAAAGVLYWPGKGTPCA